ncbi:hypothetical protein [Ramlibacter sp. PS4R-6]|uniref:hypothetical protein n=1 Tax=Ramlibacter sp. PS4R-6 TaxID=3133438 RepID=UPI003098F104
MQRTQKSNENRTASILQRLPVILAVTAASYGLTLPAGARAANAQQPAKTEQSQPAPQR